MYSTKGRKHLMNLTYMPCVFCDIQPCGEAHHIRAGTDGGMSKKPSDWFAIPCCRDCHDEIHKKGERKFYEKYNWKLEDLIDHAKSFWKD